MPLPFPHRNAAQEKRGFSPFFGQAGTVLLPFHASAIPPPVFRGLRILSVLARLGEFTTHLSSKTLFTMQLFLQPDFHK